jgi:hypothetical protein
MGGEDEPDRIVPQGVGDDDLLQNGAQFHDAIAAHDPRNIGAAAERRATNDFIEFLPIEKWHVQLEHKAVELRLGERIGSLLLQRILRREDEERRAQYVRLSTRGDAAFLHRLQQCGLRLRRRPVDLVGEQKLGENRTAAKFKLVPSVVAGTHDRGTDDVRRHKVGRELNSPEIEIERAGQCFDQLGFAQSRDSFEQHVAPGDDGHQHTLHDSLLPDDHSSDAFAKALEIITKTLGFGLEFGGIAHGGLGISAFHKGSP